MLNLMCTYQIANEILHSPIKMAKTQNTIPNAGENIEPQELSFISGGISKWNSHFWNHLVVSDKMRYTFAIWPSNHTPWYLTIWVENLHLHKNLHINIYSSFIYNDEHLEATYMPFICELTKYSISTQWILLSSKKKWSIKPWEDMAEH